MITAPGGGKLCSLHRWDGSYDHCTRGGSYDHCTRGWQLLRRLFPYRDDERSVVFFGPPDCTASNSSSSTDSTENSSSTVVQFYVTSGGGYSENLTSDFPLSPRPAPLPEGGPVAEDAPLASHLMDSVSLPSSGATVCLCRTGKTGLIIL